MNPPVDSCLVSGTLAIVLRVSQIYGVASFSFQKVRGGWLIHGSQAAYLYGIILILPICISVLVHILMSFHQDDGWAFFAHLNSRVVSHFASTFSVLIALVAQIAPGMCRVQNIINCLKQLQEINSELSFYGPRPSHTNTERLFALWSLLSGHIIGITDFSTFIYSFSITINDPLPLFSKVVLLLISYFKLLMAKMLILQISIILTNVLASFNHLNNCLKYLMEQMRSEYTLRKTSHNATYKTVNHLNYLYCCLYDVVAVVTDSYGIVLTPLILYHMLHLILTIYIIITKLFSRNVELDFALLHSLWGSHYFIDLLMIVEPCHRTYKQIKITKRLVSRLMRYTLPKDYKLMSALEVFYKHLVTNKVAYVPMQICVLDRTTIIKIFGTIVTYLVIIVPLN